MGHPVDPVAQVLAEVPHEEPQRTALAPLLHVNELMRDETGVGFVAAAHEDEAPERHRNDPGREPRNDDDAGAEPVTLGNVGEPTLCFRRQPTGPHRAPASRRRS